MYRLIRPLLFRLDAERAHGLAAAAARVAQAARLPLGPRSSNPALEQTLWGLRFPAPVGLAAGFDKNARLAGFWQNLGFGFAEVGSVSARPAPGNPRPRAFRLPEDRALVNRMGLNNDGAEVVAARLQGLRAAVPIGVNLAKTHDPVILGDAAVEDFAAAFRRLAPHAAYVALNVSCPNTAEGKTFEDPEALEALMRAVMSERTAAGLSVPVLVKLSPPPPSGLDPGLIDELVGIALGHGADGFIASNTASDRAGLRTDAVRLETIGRGGLSGPPLRARSTALVRHLYRLTAGRVPIIGVGGVDSPDAAYEKIRAGASLVQVYTGLVYEGPGLPRRIHRGLLRRLDADRLAHLSEAVGLDA